MFSTARIFPFFVGRSARAANKPEEVYSFFQRRLSEGYRPLLKEIEIDALSNTEKNTDVCKVRALFVSDVHLGTRSCRADMILSFLRKYEAETLYLIGDIIDGWHLERSWYWPKLHEEVLETIIDKALRGSRVVYIPGNHDDFLRLSYGKKATGIEVVETAIHTTVDGKRFLVMHGDQFDNVIRDVPWLAHVGDVAYDVLTAANFAYNKVMGALGFEYHSIAATVKASVKHIVNFISKFEKALVAMGRDKNVDGVVCGHIHCASIRRIQEMYYVNAGDWVENCTAVTENANGTLELIRLTF
ncbi:MAG: UDP-2,3-diacylglucosamine diphosphatase [Synergistaceae bacterium]|jgi:UDP-2,3-diacylglucosamine pyrophosphatase LpxH|nr:UDP-2,3-diacylglucosamine diphosphatase [Synergistaceae bacterium]